ncbi:hypothetical protein [Dactylosporangium darangshiense]|uniref:ABM domain-containing protein n=1 Tax=Dactylosporangium darangshiense TaxID=579108 RepID=A0ABP8D979_9ACTN
MSTAVIRYRVRPEAAEENQRLIEAVFAELAAAAPPGLRYSAYRLSDGVTFVHVVDGDGLPGVAAFQEFQRDISARLAEGPTREDASLVGAYASSAPASATGS